MSCVRAGDRIAVTGATGFVGQILVEHLASAGYRVVGISEREAPPASIAHWLDEYHATDLTRGWPKTGPLDGIVHLAGMAAVGPSFERPQDYINTNSAMVTHLFENALKHGEHGRVIVVSSGAIYGGAGPCGGLSEESPSLATSPYVVSKLLVEHQTEYYRQRGTDAIVVRPFNHIGPGQLRGFIVPDLMAKMSEWHSGTVLPVGNLDSARDYTDVRDIVCAYRLLLERPRLRHHTYNVCSGVPRSGWEVLETVCRTLRKPIPSTELTARREVDPSVIVGNARRLNIETGWKPTIELQASIDDFLRASNNLQERRGVSEL